MSMALADVDEDGDLDVYMANYRRETVKDSEQDYSGLQLVDGRWRLPADLAERYVSSLDALGRPILHETGEPDGLYLNDGTGRFTQVSWTGGAFLDEEGRPLSEPPRDWSLSAMFRDVNGDGFPDLYVCSDFVQPDRFWINQGGGRFRALSRPALTRTSRHSMGVDFADIDRDGDDDFLVVDMLSPDRVLRMRQRINLSPGMYGEYAARHRPQFLQNTLFLNRGNTTFAEVSRLAGLDATDWSWAPVFLDVDLDGFEDLLIFNGAMRDSQDSDALARIRSTRKVRSAWAWWQKPTR